MLYQLSSRLQLGSLESLESPRTAYSTRYYAPQITRHHDSRTPSLIHYDVRDKADLPLPVGSSLVAKRLKKKSSGPGNSNPHQSTHMFTGASRDPLLTEKLEPNRDIFTGDLWSLTRGLKCPSMEENADEREKARRREHFGEQMSLNMI